MDKSEEYYKSLDKRTKEYKEWKDNFNNQTSTGLGDVVETITEKTGIKKAVKFIAGEDCGCEERKEKFNKVRFRFKPVRCFSENNFNAWTKLRDHKGNFTNEHITLIHKCYEELFARKFERQSCCYDSFYKEIDRVYEQYL